MMNRIHAIAGALLCAATLCAQAAPSDGAAALKANYETLAGTLKNSPFQRPLVIASAESGSTLKGDVFAVVDHPFSAVSEALTRAPRWCDIVILHVNTKQCRVADAGGNGAALHMRIGSKNEDSPDDAHPVEFTYRLAAATPEFFSARLSAETGPLGTRDYRIIVEAAPLEDGKTFLHLTYSYGFGLPAKLAMQAYLATSGSDKVGFTRVGNGYIKGMRGVVERNAMRYYLAIDAYLAANAAPLAQRTDRRLRNFFASTEQYRRQLYDDIDESGYLAMKRKEIQLQQTAMASRTR